MTDTLISSPASPAPELLEEVQAMSSDQMEGIRELCKEDLVFLGYGVLGYLDINPFTHGAFANFIVSQPKNRRLALMPRGTLKSTLGTITDSIRLALKDPNETRILVINEVKDNAIGFLSEIKGQFMNNELLRMLFPELIPDRFTGPGVTWSQEIASIVRTSNYKEGTWNAAGVNTGVVSKHYSRIKADDLIGIEAKKSAAAMQNAIKTARELEPLLVNIGDDIIDFIGTRKLPHDLYAFLMHFFGEELAIFRRAPIEGGKSIFPQKIPLKFLQRLRENDPVTYFAEYANDPIADGSKDFKVDRVRFYQISNDGDIVYRNDDGLLSRWSREALDVVMACDPNSGSLSSPDLPAIVVLGISPLNQVFCLDAWARRVTADAYVDQIYDMYQAWRPRIVGIEQAGQQTTAEYFDLKAKQEGTYIPIATLKPRNVSNSDRIRKALQPIINRGRFFIDKGMDELINSITFHPDIENDDLLTAAAYCVTLLRAGETEERQEEREEAFKKILASRNPLTGY